MTRTPLETGVLVAVARLGDDAYGVTIHEEIGRLLDQPASMAGVYAALDRLEQAGLLRSRASAPIPERGGRSRRLYALTAAGDAQVRRDFSASQRLWRGLAADTSARRR